MAARVELAGLGDVVERVAPLQQEIDAIRDTYRPDIEAHKVAIDEIVAEAQRRVRVHDQAIGELVDAFSEEVKPYEEKLNPFGLEATYRVLEFAKQLQSQIQDVGFPKRDYTPVPTHGEEEIVYDSVSGILLPKPLLLDLAAQLPEGSMPRRIVEATIKCVSAVFKTGEEGVVMDPDDLYAYDEGSSEWSSVVSLWSFTDFQSAAEILIDYTYSGIEGSEEELEISFEISTESLSLKEEATLERQFRALSDYAKLLVAGVFLEAVKRQVDAYSPHQ